MRKNGRRKLDDWFPTVVRYAGVVLVFYVFVIDHGLHPVLIPIAAGMIGFKTIYGSGPPSDKPDREP